MCDEARSDLDRIEKRAPLDADDLWAYLELVDDNEQLIDRLASTHYRQTHADPQFDCKPIEFLQRRGYNVYRMYSLTMEWARKNYRIIYAFESEKNVFHILAVVMKRLPTTPTHLQAEAYNYEPSHPLTKRICDQYESIGIPIRH
jgi:mRNA-degrading endonuclease RelE of RelBE toxin-antitoxin system